jgi:hypothetical protein
LIKSDSHPEGLYPSAFRLVDTRWFGYLQLGAAAGAAFGCVLWPRSGPWLLLAALIPWLIQLASNPKSANPAWIRLGLAVFLLTSLMGVWSAYDQDAAVEKFWLIAASLLLFYALSNLAADDLWVGAGVLVLVSDLLSLFFLLASNPPNHDVVGGLLAMLQPFVIVLGWFAWKLRRKGIFWLVLLSEALCLSGLAASGAFAAWLALGAGLGTWFLWELFGKFESRLPFRKSLLFGVSILAGALVLGLLLVSLSNRLSALSNSLPLAGSLASRLELYRNTLELAPDFLLTGGGLGAFPGLYSTYILGIPDYMYGYSHNLYLDLIVEQGLPGLIAFLVVTVGSLWMMVRSLRGFEPGNARMAHLSCAILAALGVTLLNGLGDDPLFGQYGTPLLFILPGMALATARIAVTSTGEQTLPYTTKKTSSGLFTWIALISLAVVLILAVVFNRPLRSGWFADIGSVQLARIELAGWPEGKQTEAELRLKLQPVTATFERALSFNPENSTAHYRLGRIAMSSQDYLKAIGDLAAAHQLHQDHHGLNKQLGYSYLWTGQMDPAAELLVKIPEARNELSTYVWWWQTQGRSDLSDLAQQMLDRLNSAE